MAFDITGLINSPLGVRLAFAVGQRFPRRLGYWLADAAAGQLSRQKDSAIVRAVRSNQWVASGERLAPHEMEAAVKQTFRNTARSIFDLYHYVNALDRVGALIVMDEAARQLSMRPEFSQRGAVIAGIHLSSFDLALQWLCWSGMKPFVLTIPNPEGGRRMEFEMRKKTGMNLVPASVTALRQALRHLQQGGMVLTGIDRPISAPEACPHFFGRPASLPLHHIFLATHARVPVILMAVRREAGGKYHIITSEPIEMNSDPDRERQTLRNAEKVLAVAEEWIRSDPQQWSMSLPVWPDVEP